MSKPAIIARFSGLEHGGAAQVRAQHFGHHHAAVGLLVVFQHRHQRAAHGQARPKPLNPGAMGRLVGRMIDTCLREKRI